MGVGCAAAEDVLPRSVISIVDDDQPLAKTMRWLMRALGYAAQTLSSAANFLASPHLGQTACLIADVHMPGMNGDELHRRLIGSGRAIPTILDVVRARALKDGVICYIPKPLEKSLLVDCIRLALMRPGPIQNS